MQFVEQKYVEAHQPKTDKIETKVENPHNSRMIDTRGLEDGGFRHAHMKHRPTLGTHHPSCNTMPPIHTTQPHGNHRQLSVFKCDLHKILVENCGNIHMKQNVLALSTTDYVPMMKCCACPCQTSLHILMDSPVYGARPPQCDMSN